MGTGALILSAGESSRFGGQPKALLSIGPMSAVRRMAALCDALELDPVLVVVGPHSAPISHELRGLNAETVDSPRWFEGRTASIQSGLWAMPPDHDVLFWPVDHPFVLRSTIDALLRARDRDLIGVWFVPTFEDRGGHPVLWRPAVRPDIFDLRADAPLRSLLPEFGPQVLRVPVDDPGVVANVDTPEEYREALRDWEMRGGV
ncbi:MAG TPA: nucleotidyltransferase family protein [Thermoplasmata archaeon]|nr:nucleotidyltransferase family protein [Thermoplasmata archaeon]